MIQDINVTLNVDKGNIVDNILINNEQLRKVLREAKKEANGRIIEGEEGSYSGEYGSKGSDIVYKEHGFGTTVLEEKLRMGTANLGVSSDQENEKGGTNVTNTQHNTALGKMLVKKQLEILDRRLGLVSKMASAPNEGLGKKANNEKPNEQEEIKVTYRYDSETVDRIKNLGFSEMFSGKEPNHGIEDIRVPKEISEDVNLTQGTRTKRVTINTEHGKYKKGANRLVEGRRGVSEFRNEKRRRAIERGARDRLRGVLKKLKKELSETKKQAAKHKEKNAIDHMVLVVSVLVFAMFIGYPIINDYHTGEKRYEAVIVKGINGENEVGGLFFMWWMVLMFGMGGMIVALKTLGWM
ncbi:hypothetical protein AX774_g28 [Zancudomyces culisetae]|uniref:Uncharacterized protein n=1 Tax=Zancudomyces culisetae TaxID=1213189 RepID=A0A1R1PZM8_ZANCU|nr:hypothetical protein AX774_g28 [Zancudomyces culisetae]|eukprot:OMH86399.1 hypothetical protein AX774_g28 [Zancudomyces culisetae]